jgi:hypothetical protein
MGSYKHPSAFHELTVVEHLEVAKAAALYDGRWDIAKAIELAITLARGDAPPVMAFGGDDSAAIRIKPARRVETADA